MISIILVQFLISAHAKHGAVEWLCKMSAFTETYEALGRSKAEAKLNVKRKCTETNHEMHCKEAKCEGPDEDDNASSSSATSNLGWICKLKPFTDTYTAAGTTRAEAKLKVIKQCEIKEDIMFCKEPKCEEG